MISVSEASEQIMAAVTRGDAETLPIGEAYGRVLRSNVTAERPFPPFDRVMMDGVAIQHRPWTEGMRRFRRAGFASAGAPQQSLCNPNDAIEAMTGAVVPAGADLIVPVEQLKWEEGYVTIAADYVPPEGGYIHKMGSDAVAGGILLPAGSRLDARAMAVAVSCGASEVRVSRQPRIAVVSTGDELIDVGQPIAPHQIRRSNVYALQATLRSRGYTDVSLHHFADDPEVLMTGLGRVLDEHDCVILSGGVSVGARDHIPATLVTLRARTVFHRVAQRPGKPMLFAVRGHTLIFGLPGNPVSTLVGLCRFVLPALEQWTAAAPHLPLKVKLGEAVDFSPAFTCFLPVSWDCTSAGVVLPRPTANSGDFAALVGTNGFIELPAEMSHFEPGFLAPWYAW